MKSVVKRFVFESQKDDGSPMEGTRTCRRSATWANYFALSQQKFTRERVDPELIVISLIFVRVAHERNARHRGKFPAAVVCVRVCVRLSVCAFSDAFALLQGR